MKRRVIWVWKILKQYLSNCGIHGVKYLVNDNLSWIERVFWLFSCAICWWGCANVVVDVIQNYIYNPGVVISGDTTYLDWKTPLPSISLCITNTVQIRNKYFRLQPGSLENLPVTYSQKISAEELLTAYEGIKIPCNMLLQRCVWNDVEFDCCKEFQPLFKTGVGYCLMANSLHTGQRKAPRLNFFVNHTVKYSDLIVVNDTTKAFVHPLTVYVLNNYQIPSILSVDESKWENVRKGHTTRFDFTMTDIYNEGTMKSVPLQQRNCRFMDEIDDIKMHYMYSYDSCTVELYARRMLKMCGCVHFYYPTPPGARTCNMTELKCIYDNGQEIKFKEIQKLTCFSNCEGTSINYNKPFIRDNMPNDIARLHFKMLTRPFLRFRRYIVFDLLDLVVSIGSAFGLFMGANILSIFEIPYWLFVRHNKILQRIDN